MSDKQLAQRVREVLHYSAETGEFTRLHRLAQRHDVGSRADFKINTGPLAGYRRVGLDGKRYLAHRLAWLYVHGEWPRQVIDHINGDRGDNRIANMRDVSQGVNTENQRRPSALNRSGYLGVHLHDDGIRWRARIQVRGRGKHIGLFGTKEAAHAAYLEAKRRLHAGCTL